MGGGVGGGGGGGGGVIRAPPRICGMPTISRGPLYTSDAVDDPLRVDLGGRRIIKKKKQM